MRQLSWSGWALTLLGGAALASCNLALGFNDDYRFGNGGTGAGTPSGSSGSESSTGSTGGTGGTGGGDSLRGKAIWSTGFGDGKVQTVAALAVDLNSGASYVTGSFQGVLTLTGTCGSLSSPSTTTSGYLIKLNSAGLCVWGVLFGATGATVAGSAVAIGSGGELTVAGTYAGKGFGTPVLPDAAGIDSFVIQYPASYDPLSDFATWLQHLGGTGDQVVTGLASDGGGGVFAAGWWTQDLAIFKGAIVTPSEADVMGGASKAGFAVNLTGTDGAPNMQNINAVFTSSAGDLEVKDVAFGSGGSVVTAGRTTGGLTYSKGMVPGHGGQDAFLLRYDATLLGQASVVVGDGTAQEARSVTFGLNNGLYVAGAFQGTIDFKNSVTLTAGATTAFLASVDPGGVGIAAIPLGAFDLTSPQANVRIASAAGNEIVFAGSMQGVLSVGGLSATGHGKNDAVVGRIDGDLKKGAWLHSFGDSSDQGIDAVAVDQDDNIIVAGHFQGKLDLGDGKPLVSSGGTDIFVAKLAK